MPTRTRPVNSVRGAAAPRPGAPARAADINPGAGGPHPVAPGRGAISFSRHSARSVITHTRAASPLTILTPRTSGPAAWAVCGNHGGGLLAGDHIHLDVRVGRGAAGVIGTQASTKVYRSPDALPSRQSLYAQVSEDGLLIVAPDPITCFASAVYDQRQRIELSPTSSLVLVDWFTSGRQSRNERWQMTRQTSRTDIFIDARQIVRDVICLDATDGPIGAASRMGAFNCFATALLIGPQIEPHAARLLSQIASSPFNQPGDLLYSGCAIPGGALFRVADRATEPVSGWLKYLLAFVPALTGVDPWGRRH